MVNPFISTWDSGGPAGFWDEGLDWDTNVTPPGFVPGSIAFWLSLVTSEHASKPNFIATLSNVLQPFADMVSLLQSMPGAFNVETAVGAQLNAVGQWVNASRYIPTAITGVYFALDTTGVGFDQGTWFNTFSGTTQLTALPDDAYRRLIQLTIGWNAWDGTIPGAYAIWNSVFESLGIGLIVQDFGAMHMLYGLTGNTPDALIKAMFLAGLLTAKPAGVQIDAFLTPSVSGAPYFGFDAETSAISGFDVGAWATLNPGF